MKSWSDVYQYKQEATFTVIRASLIVTVSLPYRAKPRSLRSVSDYITSLFVLAFLREYDLLLNDVLKEDNRPSSNLKDFSNSWLLYFLYLFSMVCMDFQIVSFLLMTLSKKQWTSQLKAFYKVFFLYTSPYYVYISALHQ
jgi:hypothetical protein